MTGVAVTTTGNNYLVDRNSFKRFYHRISEDGWGWEGRAAFHIIIHRHTAVVDEEQVSPQ